MEVPNLRQRVAGEIRAEIARQRIGAADLAARVDMSPSTYKRSIDGTRPLTLDELARFADALGVPPGQFVTPRPRAATAA